MHGEVETTKVSRMFLTVMHVVIVCTVAWILFGGGFGTIGSWFGRDWEPGLPARRAILMSFSVLLLVRMSMTTLVLLKRKFGWDEAGSVVAALATYNFTMTLCGAGSDAPLGALDFAGIGCYLLGSYLNTGSELQRKKFKEDPANKGKLYTQGLFGLARHINYTGDVLWLAGWAMVTHNPWTAILPVLLFFCFAFVFSPPLAKYLQGRYGADYEAWTKRTKKLIPFVY